LDQLSPPGRLAPALPFQVAQQGALDPNKEVPPLVIPKGGAVKVHLKTLKVPFKSQLGEGEPHILKVISRRPPYLPFWGKFNVARKHEGVVAEFILTAIIGVGYRVS